MTQYVNLPQYQQNLQRLVDRFNQDEAIWRSLEPRRRARRKIFRRLTKKQHHALDLIEFAALRLEDECVGLAM